GRIAPDDIADQKIPLLEPLLIFADHAAKMGGSLHEELFAVGELVKDFLELNQSRLAAELVNDVPLRLGDDEVPADGAAALGDDGSQANRAPDEGARKALRHTLAAQDQPIFPGLKSPTGHSAPYGNSRAIFVE